VIIALILKLLVSHVAIPK